MTRRKDVLTALRGETLFVLADGTTARVGTPEYWLFTSQPSEPYINTYHRLAPGDVNLYQRELAFEVYDDEE